MTVFICICSEEYLGYYNILYKSLQKYVPNVKQILYFIGKNIPSQFDSVVNITELYNNCNSSYSKLERICSLRSQVVLDAFNKGYNNVVFTGAKIEFFDNPYKLIDPLNIIIDPDNAVVTPHILEPLPEDGKFPSNAAVSWTGHISTDVVSFRNCPEVIKFLTWQDDIMKNNCKTTNYTYLDQSWLNFLPFFVDNIKILRDPAYNIAYWNFKQRGLYLKDTIWYTNNHHPMVCFQYSGLDLNCPDKISNHQDRYIAEGDFLQFLKDYIERLK